MAAYNKFNSGIDILLETANAATDQLTVALTAAASAPVAANSVIADLTQIAYTFLSARTLTTNSGGQASGTYSLAVSDLTLTASGGTVATFRYVVVYDDTLVSDPLICWFDKGGDVTMADGESFTLDFPTNLFTAS